MGVDGPRSLKNGVFKPGIFSFLREFARTSLAPRLGLSALRWTLGAIAGGRTRAIPCMSTKPGIDVPRVGVCGGREIGLVM